MTIKEFFEFIEKEMIPEGFSIMNSKGESYSGLEDKLGNFKRCAKLTGISPRVVLFIYLAKHWDALCAFMRGEYKDSESIKSRVLDIINYMWLLAALLKEEGELK